MKLFTLVFFILNSLVCISQSNPDYFVKMATQAGIKQPVPRAFASQVVRNPIKMDSLSMAKWHHDYVLRMQVGTGLLGGGVLLVAAHIFVLAFVPHFNRNAVIATAAIGVGAMSPGSLLLPIAASERHRYKKSLRIELAKRGF